MTFRAVQILRHKHPCITALNIHHLPQKRTPVNVVQHIVIFKQHIIKLRWQRPWMNSKHCQILFEKVFKEPKSWRLKSTLLNFALVLQKMTSWQITIFCKQRWRFLYRVQSLNESFEQWEQLQSKTSKSKILKQTLDTLKFNKLIQIQWTQSWKGQFVVVKIWRPITLVI